MEAVNQRYFLAAISFVVCGVVLSVQLITPTEVVVSLGENTAEVNEFGRYYEYGDVAVIVSSTVLFAASGTYLWIGQLYLSPARPAEPIRPRQTADGGMPNPGTRREAWDTIAAQLDETEATVYRLAIDADGVIPQKGIVEESELSKATVSRTLTRLERRDLVERQRQGKGNIVRLK